jgi:hypothetical protein
MALRPKNEVKNENPAPKFETEEESVAGLATAEAAPSVVIGAVSLEAAGDTAVIDVEAKVKVEDTKTEDTKAEGQAAVDNAATEAEAKAKATETAVALVRETKVAAAAKKFVKAMDDKENVFDPASLDFNTFPRVVVGLDGFSIDDGRDLGKVIQIEVMSFNSRFVAAPGDDSDEAKQHVRYSLDGIHIDSKDDFNGTLISDYIKHLKHLGYNDADRKEYLSIYGFMTHSDGAEIAEADREIIALQVPPQSRTLFDRHRMTEGVKIARGVVAPTDFLVCTQEKVNGTKKYAQIKFSSVRPVA